MDVDAARAAITAANQHNSPLLRLPAELRNRVYEYALGGCNLLIVLMETEPETLKLRARRGESLPAFALLKACSQTYAETALLPYSLNVFDCFDLSPLAILTGELSISAKQAIRVLSIFWRSIENNSFKTVTSLLLPFEGLRELRLGYPIVGLIVFSDDIEAQALMVSSKLKAVMPSVKVSTWNWEMGSIPKQY